MPDRCADQLIFEARNKHSAADHERLLLRRAAFEFFAVDGAAVIQRDRVALLNRTVGHVNQASRSFARGFDFFIHFFVGNDDGFGFDGQILVLPQPELGRDGKRNDNLQSVFVHHFDVEFGLGDGIELLFVENFDIMLVERDVQRVVVKDFDAVTFGKHVERNFSGTEAFDFVFVFIFVVSLLDRGSPFFFVDADCKFDFGFGKLLY